MVGNEAWPRLIVADATLARHCGSEHRRQRRSRKRCARAVREARAARRRIVGMRRLIVGMGIVSARIMLCCGAVVMREGAKARRHAGKCAHREKREHEQKDCDLEPSLHEKPSVAQWTV